MLFTLVIKTYTHLMICTITEVYYIAVSVDQEPVLIKFVNSQKHVRLPLKEEPLCLRAFKRANFLQALQNGLNSWESPVLPLASARELAALSPFANLSCGLIT